MGAQRRQEPQLEGWPLRGGGAGRREGAFEQISAGVEGSAEESNSGAGGAPGENTCLSATGFYGHSLLSSSSV